MTDHTDLRDRIEDLLKDSGNSDWSTGEIDNALQLALDELSAEIPAHGVTTIDAVDDTWEYDVSTVSGLVEVVEVWYPYLSTSVTYRQPHPVPWRMVDDSTLLLLVDDTPDATYDLRVFYNKLQTLNGFLSATATTLSEAMKSALVFGAAGYCAIALAMDKVDTVTIGGTAPEDLRKWGWARIQEFERRVTRLAEQAVASESSVVGAWATDKWDE